MSSARLRARRSLVAAAALLVSCSAPAATPLPQAFGDIAIGMQWDALEAEHDVVSIDHLTTAWDHHARACGYRTVQIAAGERDVLITVQDFVVTELSYTSAITPGSDPRAVADRVIKTYGTPRRAEMRNGFGQPTLGTDVNMVLLEYPGEHEVWFTVIGAQAWQYVITVRHADRRFHENRTLRCARERAARAATE